MYLITRFTNYTISVEKTKNKSSGYNIGNAEN